MTLIKSISGIRGTIGGEVADALTPLDIVRFTASYADFIRKQDNTSKTIIVGRDARISGAMVSNIVAGTLMSCGFDVLDIGFSTTPTVEVAVQLELAAGGIIITASHNPKEWNALKLLNEKGEFLSAKNGEEILALAENDTFTFSEVDSLGKYTFDDSFNNKHINEVLNLKLVNVDLVKSAGFKVVLDAVNSTGGLIIPSLLTKMGVECIKLFCEPNGQFPHNPEPLPENLTEISALVVKEKADFGIVVDPDVDRLVFFDENGVIFGEEYTQVVCSDYILSKNKGNTVSTLSSSNAMRDITLKHGCEYFYTAVGEMNVVKKMKEVKAVVGGEGGGGIIYPNLHYGRDALIGTALFLSLLTTTKEKVSEIKKRYSVYFMSKLKIKLSENLNVDLILSSISDKYSKYNPILIDGVFIEFDSSWVHLRKSNTEPIIRIFTESKSKEEADKLANQFYDLVKTFN